MVRGSPCSACRVAAGLLVNTILGPLVLDAIDYPISQTIENQLIGLELVSVFVVAPLCAAAAVLGGRGHPAGGAPGVRTGRLHGIHVRRSTSSDPSTPQYTPGDLLQLGLVRARLVARGLGVGSQRPRGPCRGGTAPARLRTGVDGPRRVRPQPLRRCAARCRAGSAIPAEFAASRRSTGRSSCSTSASSCRGPCAAVAVLRGARLARRGAVCRGRLVRARPAFGGVDGDRSCSRVTTRMPRPARWSCCRPSRSPSRPSRWSCSCRCSPEAAGAAGAGTADASADAAGAELDGDPWPHRLGGLGDAVVPGALARPAHDHQVAVAERGTSDSPPPRGRSISRRADADGEDGDHGVVVLRPADACRRARRRESRPSR